ncbi:hypothetical protein AAFF_G00309500 [Aldrovandia affinis]|uniref:Uncharacterized protein n=1 Tax=Aldrovandia affinis TaxID=143900 RepID=A0AAD7WR07_9TELE|nr:hypothetical protein AAFF_G00309500 [Aldrovandia affinis]
MSSARSCRHARELSILSDVAQTSEKRLLWERLRYGGRTMRRAERRASRLCRKSRVERAKANPLPRKRVVNVAVVRKDSSTLGFETDLTLAARRSWGRRWILGVPFTRTRCCRAVHPTHLRILHGSI